MQYFLDDFWNFQNFVKIWTRWPPNYYQNALNESRQNWNDLWNMFSFYIWESEKHEVSRSPVYLTSRCCYCFPSFFLFLILLSDNIVKSWKVDDEEWPGINFPLIKSTKAWIWISFRSKNMKRNFANFFIFGQGNPYH